MEKKQIELNTFIVSPRLGEQKSDIISFFRKRGEESLEVISRNYSNMQYKEKAKAVNKAVSETRNKLVAAIIQKAQVQQWNRRDLVNAILMTTYCSYVVMIDMRNSVWPYEYMTFSRRIGEIWELFCKIPFEYPINDLELFIPPLFADVKKLMTGEIETYIDKLQIQDEQKSQLKCYYNKVWNMVTSGEIKLELDLHFKQDNVFYNIDFKSGFSSNEKGNTNRLLLVATIFHNLTDNYKCCLFVREKEEENNQYFKQLRDSGIWTAFCGDATYAQIKHFTGFNLKEWIDNHIDWKTDLQHETLRQLSVNNLVKYLEW
ncbi:MAG: hypothetical protein LBM77_01445 [Spirochaetaceae bacterium]|jgi:hypothetical protein|nr:hypothetical protein [Spirochaetaceae bacterium]